MMVQQPCFNLASTNCVGINTGEVLQHQLVAQAPAGTFVAADGGFLQHYTPAALPAVPLAAEPVVLTDESVQMECMVLQQQLTQKQQLAQQLAQHRAQVQAQQQVITLQPQMPQQAIMATVYDSSGTVQPLQPTQQQLLQPAQQQLLGLSTGSPAYGFTIAGVDPVFGNSCSYASAGSMLAPASPCNELTQATFLQAQQQQQQSELIGSAAALPQLSCSSDGILLPALHSQDSLGSYGGSSYTTGSDDAVDAAGDSSRAAGFFPGSLDRGIAAHGSGGNDTAPYDDGRVVAAALYGSSAASSGRYNSDMNIPSRAEGREAAPHGSDKSTGAAAYSSCSGDRGRKGGSWRRRDGVLVVPCTGVNSPRSGSAAAAAQSAPGAAAAARGRSSHGNDSGRMRPES
jgi:hypothetical protein